MKPKFKVGDLVTYKDGCFKVIKVRSHDRFYSKKLFYYEVQGLQGNPYRYGGVSEVDLSPYLGLGYKETSQVIWHNNPSDELIKLAELFGDEVKVIKGKKSDLLYIDEEGINKAFKSLKDGLKNIK